MNEEVYYEEDDDGIFNGLNDDDSLNNVSDGKPRETVQIERYKS